MKILHVGEYVNGGIATYLRTLFSTLQKYDDIENYLLVSDYKSQKNWENINIATISKEKKQKNVFKFEN